VVEPAIAPELAWMVVLPCPTLVAKPLLLIVAIPVASEFQVAVLVRFCVLLSLYVPVAVNCCVSPKAIEGFAGITRIETSSGGLTVRVVEPEMDPELALIVVRPCAIV
jgi:hypothetical protein